MSATFYLIYVLNQKFPSLLPETVCWLVLMTGSHFTLVQNNIRTLYSSHTDVYFAEPSVPSEAQKNDRKWTLTLWIDGQTTEFPTKQVC